MWAVPAVFAEVLLHPPSPAIPLNKKYLRSSDFFTAAPLINFLMLNRKSEIFFSMAMNLNVVVVIKAKLNIFSWASFG